MFMVECNVNSDMHAETRIHKNTVLNSAFRRAAETETFHHGKLFMHSHADNKAGNIKKKTRQTADDEKQRPKQH